MQMVINMSTKASVMNSSTNRAKTTQQRQHCVTWPHVDRPRDTRPRDTWWRPSSGSTANRTPAHSSEPSSTPSVTVSRGPVVLAFSFHSLYCLTQLRISQFDFDREYLRNWQGRRNGSGPIIWQARTFMFTLYRFSRTWVDFDLVECMPSDVRF